MKKKFVDALFTFIGSIIALFIYGKVLPFARKFLERQDISDYNIEKVLSFSFSFLVAAGFIFTHSIFFFVKSFFTKLWRPKIEISFHNERDKPIHEIDFTLEPMEPKFLRVVFSAKFSFVQLSILKLFNAKILLAINPKMCALELDSGFIGNSDELEIYEQNLIFDLFKKYSPSKKLNDIYLDINLQLVSAAKGEVRVKLFISDKYHYLNNLFGWLCKFQIDEIEIVS